MFNETGNLLQPNKLWKHEVVQICKLSYFS